MLHTLEKSQATLVAENEQLSAKCERSAADAKEASALRARLRSARMMHFACL
jgi:hypothetical protein